MQASTLRLLQTLRPNLRQRWEKHLRAIPPTSPLANPNTLVYMMDRTLNEILAQPKHKKRATVSKTNHTTPVSTHHRAELCACGLNPLLAYFETAERALIECENEILSLSTGIIADELRLTIGAAKLALANVAQREVETFCSLCRRRADLVESTSNAACLGKTTSGR
jgi:hypothetical protein